MIYTVKNVLANLSQNRYYDMIWWIKSENYRTGVSSRHLNPDIKAAVDPESASNDI